jgi:hypothetical protein
LIGKGEKSDLRKAEIKPALKNRIHGGQERLHHIVEQMTEAGGPQHGENRFGPTPKRDGLGSWDGLGSHEQSFAMLVLAETLLLDLPLR